MKSHVRYLLLLVVAIICLPIYPVRGDNKNVNVLEAYSLGDTKYSEVKDLLMAVKTTTGTINYVKGANKVFVYDRPNVHLLVKTILAQRRAPSVNVTVDIEFQNLRMMEERGLKLGGALKAQTTGSLSKKKIRKGTITQTGRDQGATVEQNHRMTLMVASGRAGELWSTRDVLDTASLKRYGLEPWPPVATREGRRGFPRGFVRAVGTHMWIKPTYMPSGLVHVEVFPVVRAEVSDGNQQYFRVSNVRTVVTVQPKQKVFIGGANAAMTRFFRDLFHRAATSRTATDSLSIYVTAQVRIMNPAESPAIRPSRGRMWKHFPQK